MRKIIQCIKCGKETRNPKFCSRSCSAKVGNVRKHSLESKEKVSKTLTGVSRPLSVEVLKCRTEKYKLAVLARHEKEFDELLLVDFYSLNQRQRRNRIFLEQSGKCNKCNLDKWNEYRITLELEHINGDRGDNTRENLELLCPNCHSQTHTWRGRNIQKISKNRKVSDETILLAIATEPNIRQVLIKVGLTPKGRNYIRIKKLMKICAPVT